MKKNPLHRFAGFTLVFAGMFVWQANAGTRDSVSYKLTIKSFLDFGDLVSGSNPYPNNITAGQTNPDISMLPLDRANVSVVQEAALNQFDVAAGLSGLVWWPYGGGVNIASERVMNVKPMIPVARIRWRFGDPASVTGALQIGTFAYKYNPDAKDLGEYLYRSGTYPGFLFNNDGWLLMNRASNYSHGALLTLSEFNGMLKHNFSLFMETQYYPIGDFSPGYDFSLTTKWFEFGGGAVLNHYLSARPSLLTPRIPQNTYVVGHVDTLGDTTGYRREVSWGSYLPPQDSVIDTVRTGHWTFKGVKLMARAALNLGWLLPEEVRGPEDLRLFTEIAILGWEDYPVYYQDRMQRMPIMVGINLPTAKLLDVLSIQGEYYSSPYNDIQLLNTNSLPIWQYPYNPDQSGNYLTDSAGNIRPIHRDDIRWSVYAKKTVNKLVSVYAQVASDNFRLTDGKYNVSSIPLISSPSQWYYLIRLEFSLR